MKNLILNLRNGRLGYVAIVSGILFSLASPAAADPLNTPYWRTFHINTLGVAADGAASYRQLMLANTGGVMPRNVKVGFSGSGLSLFSAKGGYYDYLPSTYNLDASLAAARANDLPIGIHLNAMPWDDSATQASDILHNYLEKYNAGALLQVDRFGRIRDAALAQDPTIDEQAGTFSPFMEMQLTLSPYAPLIQDYLVRNTRIAARYFVWLQEQAPDLVTFCTMSSEFGMNTTANNDYCDYSVWSQQEFRDWLSGAGAYAGSGQYASLAAFNNAFTNATGFPWASWTAVVPPTNVLWTATPDGNWWKKWQQFRVQQVQNIEQLQMRAARSAGWNPDQLFGHQIPGTANSTSDTLTTQHASPWTTTFVQEGGDGITTYGANASSATIFNAVYADDKNWGIGEYNPLSSTVSGNLNALNTVWNYHAHLLCPYNWTQAGYAISNTVFLTALQQFIGNHANDALTNMAAYEAAPASHDVIWTMSYADDVTATSGLNNQVFSNGVFSASITNASVSLALALDSNRHTLPSEAFYALSLRLFFSNAPAGPAVFEWTDTNSTTGSVSFAVHQGWNLCRVNLGENAGWREKNIQALTLQPPGSAGNGLQLDWLRLEAGPCWNLDDTNEVYGVANFSNWSVTNGQFSGTSGADGYLYFSTDKHTASANADRAFIDADFYKIARVRMTSSAAANAQLYWWTAAGVPYVTSFPVSAGTQTYTINLSSNANWVGLVTRLRLDPVNANGVVCAVDYLALSPILLPPRAKYFDTIANSSNPVFLWEPATEPDHTPLTYDFQLAANFGFTNVVLAAASLNATNLTYAGPDLDGLYWWRVRSRDGAGNVSPWLVPMPLFVRVWNANSTDDFTGLNQYTNVVVSNGVWSAQATSGDPYFSLNLGNNNNGPGVNADLYKQAQLRLRVNAPPGAGSTAQLLFFPDAGGTYSVNFTVPPDGQWYERTIDLSSNANWTGYINRVRIDPTSAVNATVSFDWVRFVPSGALAANQPPALSAFTNRTVMAGSNLTVNVTASDPNVPPQTLTYSLAEPSLGAQINPTNGLFTWRPAMAQAPSTNLFTIQVTDNGTPVLSATNSFWVTVNSPISPGLSAVSSSNGVFTLTVSGNAGPDYVLQTSTNLTPPVNWRPIQTNASAAPPFSFSDTGATNFNQRFYRVQLQP